MSGRARAQVRAQARATVFADPMADSFNAVMQAVLGVFPVVPSASDRVIDPLTCATPSMLTPGQLERGARGGAR